MDYIDKNLKKIKDTENIVIPDSLRNKLNEAYSQIQEKEETVVSKYVKQSLKVACVLIVIIVGINFVNPILAEEVPLFGPVIKVLNENFGLEIRYTENGLVVNESFNTENFKITIETVDYVNEQIFIVYKVEGENLEEGIYSLFLQAEGEGFTAIQGDAIATGDLKNSIYYGYTSMELKFDEIKDNRKEITLKLKPIYFEYITQFSEGSEEIITHKEINLTIENKSNR